MVGNYCRLLLLVLLLCSCGSSRLMQQTDTAVSVQNDAEIRQLAFHGSQIKLTDLVKTDMTIRFHWVKFDTDKEPDAQGNYPKEAEGDGVIDFKGVEELDIIQNDSTQVETEADFSHEEEAEEHSQSESKIEETTIFEDITWLCFSCIILMLIVWFVRR